MNTIDIDEYVEEALEEVLQALLRRLPAGDVFAVKFDGHTYRCRLEGIDCAVELPDASASAEANLDG